MIDFELAVFAALSICLAWNLSALLERLREKHKKGQERRSLLSEDWANGREESK